MRAFTLPLALLGAAAGLALSLALSLILMALPAHGATLEGAETPTGPADTLPELITPPIAA